MPLFSVIIPTYNRAKELGRALESLTAQACKDFEVIVCDDGSMDDSQKVAETFRDRLVLKYLWEKNWGGPARPRNNGLKLASGDWVCFLDADDWWYPEKLAVTAGLTSESDVIYHDLDIWPRKHLLARKKTRARRFRRPVFQDMLLHDAGIPNSSVAIRKSILDAVEGFTEDKALVAVEDLDLWLKIARMTERFTYIPRSLGAYWTGGSNISEVSEKQASRLMALYERHVPYLDDAARDSALALLSYNVGRIKYKNGKFQETIPLMARALGSPSFAIRFKALLTMAFSQMKRRL